MEIVKPDTKGELYRDKHDPNGYKIRCGYFYPVYRQEYGGKVFYKIPVNRKSADGAKITGYKVVSFRNPNKNTDIPNNSIIQPLSLYEDFYYGKVDKYNPIFTLVITDWNIKDTTSVAVQDAVGEYTKTIDMAYDDDDLPF